MGLSKEYTDDRLDRLAGATRDGAASRRGDNFRPWRTFLAVGVALLIGWCAAVDDVDAAPLMSTQSAYHSTPISAALLEARTDQRLDDLSEKISADSDQADEDLQHLRRNMESSLEELDDEWHDRLGALFGVAMLVILLLYWVGGGKMFFRD